MSTTLCTWTGTLEDGYNSTAIGMVDAAGNTVRRGVFRRVYFNGNTGTEASTATFIVYGDSTKTDDLAGDTLSAAEVAAGGAYISDEARHVRPAYYWVAKADTGAATLIGKWTFELFHDDGNDYVYTFVINPALEPSDA